MPPNRGHALHSVSPICCHANFQRRFLLHEERKIARNKRIRNAYFAPYYFSLFSLRDKSSIKHRSEQFARVCPRKTFLRRRAGSCPRGGAFLLLPPSLTQGRQRNKQRAPRAFLRTILTKNTYSGNAIFHFFGYNQRRKRANGRSGKKRQKPRPARRRK